MADRVGMQVGNYRLTHLLGHGNFAEVYLGMHRHSGTQAAIKLWQAPLASASEIETFREEAQTIATLQRPHILRVLEFGVEGGHPYLVLDYAPGGSLRKLHPAGTSVPLATVVSYVQQITQALRFAHDQQLIHRNLKPSNLLVGRNGAILLSDFGLSVGAARARREPAQGEALTGAYIAPEQWQGHPLPASDQYALGVVVYEWLTGQLPTTGALQEVSANHPVAVPPPARGPLPSLPAAVEQVVMIALAKDPKERFANVSAFARALEQASQTVERAFPVVPPPPGTFPPRDPLASIQAPPAAAPAVSLPPTGHPPAEAGSLPAGAAAGAAGAERWYQASAPPPGAAPQTFLAPPTPLSPGLTPRRRKRPLLWALVGLLLLVLGGGSLVGWGLTGHGPLAAGGRNTATPHPSVTIAEFVLPQQGSVPDGITLGPDGNVWFTEVDVGKIGRISPSGSITQFSLPAFYVTPSGITAGPDGNLWFIEGNGNRIGRITPTGTITEFALSRPDRFPLHITAGPDGNLWFTESLYQNLIGRITPTGTITEFAVPTHAAPGAITTGPDHNLWFTDAGTNQIGRITPSGTITEFAVPTVRSAPVSITVGPDGNLWFTEYTSNKIGRITLAGAITEFAVSTATSKPGGITTGPDGALWFTEDAGNKIGRITPTGAITEFAVHTAKSRPDGITTGPDGALWFTESDGNQIGRLTIRR